MIIVLSVGPH